MAKSAVKLTVVQKRTANSAVDNPLYDEEQKFLEDLRGELWGRGGSISSSWAEVAKETKLARSTISNFATGQTKRPTVFTVRRIAMAFGYAMRFVKIGKGIAA